MLKNKPPADCHDIETLKYPGALAKKGTKPNAGGMGFEYQRTRKKAKRHKMPLFRDNAIWTGSGKRHNLYTFSLYIIITEVALFASSFLMMSIYITHQSAGNAILLNLLTFFTL